MIFDLIIVGAGPTGLEAALQAQTKKLNYLLIDKLDAGSLIETTMANKKFYHVYGRNTATPKGLLNFPDRLKGTELVTLWKAQTKELNFHKAESLVQLTRQDNIFTITTTQATHDTRFVLLTSGTFEHPLTLGLPGESDHPNIHYTLDYYQNYQGEQIVVVGGGNSACETAIYCAPHNATTLVVRKDQFRDSVTPLNRSAIEKLVTDEKLTILWNSTISSIDPNQVTISTGTQTTNLPYNHLFVHIGFKKPTDFLTELGIEIKGEQPVLNEKFETNIPGLYIAGALTGADSVVECANQAVQIITQLPRLPPQTNAA